MPIILQSILWAVFGVVLYRGGVVDKNLPRLLGRALYWVGVPVQIFFLARQSNFEQISWLPSLITIIMLLVGLVLAILVLEVLKQLIFAVVSKLTPQTQLDGLLLSVGMLTSPSTRQLIDEATPKNKRGSGSFILASILGSTCFIDLVLVPPLVDPQYWSWIVLYGVAHNIIGSYGLGVLIADYYGGSGKKSNWSWSGQLKNLLFLPSLWAFAYGYVSRDIKLPNIIETGITQGALFVVPGAFILIGMQLSTLQQWQNLRTGIVPSALKMLILPGLSGLLFTFLGMQGDSRLVLVLMCSMPTAFASVILAEEYNLDRQIAASSILLSTLVLPIILLFWLAIF